MSSMLSAANTVVCGRAGGITKGMQWWAGGRMQVEVIVFSNAHGELGRTEKALEYIRILREQVSKT